jgi:hypothetical protein
MSIAATTNSEPAPLNPVLLRITAGIACVALADWLFFGWAVGISLALFLAGLGVVAVAINGVRAPWRSQIIMTAIFIAGLITLVEDVGILSVIASVLATCAFVIVMTARDAVSWQRTLFEAATVPLRGPFQLVGDFIETASRLTMTNMPEWLRPGSLIAWIVPLLALAVFLFLFASANPLIEQQLLRLNPGVWLARIGGWRVPFWIAIGCVTWPLLLRRICRLPQATVELLEPVKPAPIDWNYLFDTRAVTRALILCNALFALQSGLDLAYLWGDLALPNGMSHAEYAHRGAYPLVATALLAAAFVLIAMRPGGPAENSRLIRPLVLAWIGQNVLLVISSIFRLDLYIAAFSLTYLRIAAFIWMALVAIGLVLILTQIVRGKSNAWLLSANAISLALVLYSCCFLNAPWLVAYYNVEHCREVGGSGPNLDIVYLTSLGSPQTLPPVEAHRTKFPAVWRLSLAYRTSPDRQYLSRPGNWRAWTFRTWRLERYFANTPLERLNPLNDGPDNGKG